jgi:hypothetical protein
MQWRANQPTIHSHERPDPRLVVVGEKLRDGEGQAAVGALFEAANELNDQPIGLAAIGDPDDPDL